MSLFVNGTCIGVKKVPQTNRNTGETWDTFEIGISAAKIGGFEGETETISIKVSKDQEKAGICQLYASAKGKELWVPVWVRCFPTNKGASAGYQFALSGDGKPLDIG